MKVGNRDRDSILEDLVGLNVIFLEKNDRYTVMEEEYNSYKKVGTGLVSRSAY